jgi:hypothetical protein
MGFNVIPFDEYQYPDKFLDFCKTASQEVTQPASVNMWSSSWEQDLHTLPYKLFIEKIYTAPRGTFYLVLHNNEIVACSGAYRSEFCSSVLIAGARTWVSNSYRNLLLLRDYLLPAQKKFAIDNNYQAVALSFNSYNKNIIKIWKRSRLGEKLSPRESHHMFYNNFNEVEFPVEIQYTPQWVIYEKLNSNFNFDWNNLRS